MAGTVLPIISSCARSPYFSSTRAVTVNYGDHEGRLTPLSFGRSTTEEYWILRKTAGLFDVPEVPLEISGRDAAAFVDTLFTRPMSSLKVDRGRYGLLCHHDGGIVCDGVVFRLSEDRFWYVHADRDVFTWMQAHRDGFDVSIHDPQAWALQVQGPAALKVLAGACDLGLPDKFGYFHSAQVRMGGQDVLVSRTGWTGELGFEIYNLDPDINGPALWSHLLETGNDFGLSPCGTLSMNTRRIEAGILNYGTDMNWDTSPFDVGLGMFVDLQGADFVGKRALASADKRSRFTGFRCLNGDVKWNSAILHHGEKVGRVKAFGQSPYLQSGVGFALFDQPEAMKKGGFSVVDRTGNEQAIELHTLPFYDSGKRIPRGQETADL